MIARQREALAELRARLRAMEQQGDAVPCKPGAVLLYHLINEALAELRARLRTMEQQGDAVPCKPGALLLYHQINEMRAPTVSSIVKRP